MLNENTKNQVLFELIGHANEGMAKAAAIRDAEHRQAQAIAAEIPAVLNALVENRRIAPGDSVKMASMLRDPVTALQVLKEVAAHDNNPRPNTLGQVYKTASKRTNSLADTKNEALEELFQTYNL